MIKNIITYMENRTYRCGTPKPFYRGISHGLFSIIYIFLGFFIFYKIYNWSIFLFIISQIFGYMSSFLYHFFQWTHEYDMLFHKLDYIGIFVLMISPLFTYCNHFLSESFSSIILSTVFIIFSIGVSEIIYSPNCRFIITCKILYGIIYGIGLITMLFLNIESNLYKLLISSIIIYVIGFIIFFTQYPNPYPDHFGYHELFHICTIIGSLIHYYINYVSF
jgi:hemolysin III